MGSNENIFAEFQRKKQTVAQAAHKALDFGWIKKEEYDAIVKKLDDDKLTIGIIGQMKCGKSTFLNAFIFEDDVLPAATTPMTAALSVITYGPEKKIEAEFYTPDEWAEQKMTAAQSLDGVTDDLLRSQIQSAKELVEKSSLLPGPVERFLGKRQSDSLDRLVDYVGADSFLGKRISNVSQGAEQSINSQRSQMLIYLEEFKGVVIFATNLQSNVDKAFESRILAHIKLDLPSREARADIIKGLIPAGSPLALPLTADDLLRAADAIEGLAGREIKQAVKTLLFRKAAEDGDKAVFSADDFVEAMAAKKKEVDELANEEAARKKAENEKKKQKIKESMQRNAQEKIEYLDGMTVEDLQAAIDRRPEVEARKKAEQESIDSQA